MIHHTGTFFFQTWPDDETFYGDWSEIGLESTDETPEAQSVGDNSIEAAESDGTNKAEELQEMNLTEEQQSMSFRINEEQDKTSIAITKDIDSNRPDRDPSIIDPLITRYRKSGPDLDDHKLI